MKEYKPDKDAVFIYEQIEDRIAELWGKLTSDNYNAATQSAFQIGCIADIEDALKKIKNKKARRMK
jgi:hypothetical protein